MEYSSFLSAYIPDRKACTQHCPFVDGMVAGMVFRLVYQSFFSGCFRGAVAVRIRFAVTETWHKGEPELAFFFPHLKIGAYIVSKRSSGTFRNCVKVATFLESCSEAFVSRFRICVLVISGQCCLHILYSGSVDIYSKLGC